ncbi:indolepyruvate oxidoreductase subunit beta family protein [Emcibacter sp.]|uniref:indolepyruvate oxidoreductase subunit beta family protein n=1 Tax=Emcibacter sp. TaxID=1979954 RepID=UPI002AA5EF91|nr:indolepyruvate oxidoreductase subunit beta family protein [Emcibacter sp.]
MTQLSKDRSINIAIIAMGGQGGGVLSKWILDLAETQGYMAQYTSVPGVAQRTGATIYYIELFPAHLAEQAGRKPVLALTPIPGDVDIVIASEMMEAGRALVRGFVTDKTTLLASDHRDYAIVEKQEMGDGRRELDNVRRLSEKSACKFICFDMDTAARSVGSVISSVLFGALAGANALPFERSDFEKTIEDTKKAVEANLRGFALGFERAQGQIPVEEIQAAKEPSGQPSPAVAPLLQRMKADFPGHAQYLITEGMKKLVDYQDPAYADLYLDRLAKIAALDKELGGEKRSWALTKSMARYLALAMAYDDTIRVADLKVRASRFERFRDEVKADEGQIVDVSEYLHPRLEELCDILPAGLGNHLLNSRFWRAFFGRFMGKGRRITTTRLPGFLLFYTLSSLKGMRRGSLRYKKEAARIEAWVGKVMEAARLDYDLGCEMAGMQRLIKGYSGTHERGLTNVARIMTAYEDFKGRDDAVESLKTLKSAALKDEEGVALQAALDHVGSTRSAA